MASRRAIDLALDLARMPALAQTSIMPPIPPDVIDLMRIAAHCPQSCQAAVAKTGQPAEVLIEAARFYLQQVLLRPDADCYRVLGIEPSASRAKARDHMRWLLKWLHPDHNGDWDSVYTERVLKAWREVAAGGRSAQPRAQAPSRAALNDPKKAQSASIRLPWIRRPVKKSRPGMRRPRHALVRYGIPAGAAIIVLLLWSIFYYFGPGQTAAMTQLQ